MHPWIKSVKMKCGGVQVKWQSILLFQKTAGYSKELHPLSHPLVTADQ